jgi:uncharacterized protein (DUF4415 family)
MAKKLSGSSRPEKLTRVSADSIIRKPLTKRQKSTLTRVGARQKAGDDSQIDYSDIGALTDTELAEFRRPVKRLIAVRLDADVFEWLRSMGPGYSTRINHVLRAVMERSR